jgi:class 3 adenylate cyclase
MSGGLVTIAASSACPTCGAETQPGARFCPACGAGLVGSCPACGAETRVGAQFCAACGHPLERPAAREEERKLVTILFADLTGSTTLGEQLDPERLRVLLAEYFAAMAAVIDSWGGTVEKFIGDAVMAVFGIPVLHEDDAERALRAALEMQARLGAMNPELAERHGVELAMRVGVNTGEVIAGTGGDQFMVTGDAVNVAARLQQTAEPGEVVAGERTQLAARGAFAFEPLAEKALKGKSLPVAAWRLVGEVELVRPRGVPGISARLVGRETELTLLETLYRRAVAEGRPALVTILGQAGIGKTRLTEEFVARAAAGSEAAAVYRGRCLPYGQGITYWALREILWSATGILLDDSGAEAAEKLRRLVHGLLDGSAPDSSEADRVLFALATSAGIAVPGNPLDELSPESIGEELGLAWPRLVSALAQERPTLVIVEDLHWAEPPLLDMIEHLVSRSSGRLLLLATARPEFAEMRPAWSARPAMSQIALEPLNVEQTQELVSELLPESAGGLRQRVLAAAEGNPFFAEEIVRHLVDQGAVAGGDGGAAQAEADVRIAIPDTVRALLAARIDALPVEEKLVLQEAAAVGRVFWTTTLESMRPESRIRDALRGLEDKGLVVTQATSSLPGETELVFRHGLTREVAYESVPKGRRARAHADVGRWLEVLAGDRREEYVDLLAYHYESASSPEHADLAWPGDPEAREEVRAKAVAALIDAGEAAKTRFAVDQARGFADRALTLAATEPERLAALELKAEAGHAGVRPGEAWPCYLEALEVAERIGDRETASRLRARATLFWARYRGAFTGDEWKASAIAIVDRGLEEAGEESLTFETGALLAGRSCLGLWELGERATEDCIRDAERAVEIAETIGSPVLLSYALDALAAVVSEEGFCGSTELGERLLEASKAVADRWGAHEMLVTAALCLSEAGRFETASATAEEAAREALNLSPHHRLHGAAAQTAVLLARGRMDELLDATAQAVDLVVEEGMHTCFHGLQALAGSALAAFEAGERSRATSALEVFDAVKEGALLPGYGYQTIETLQPVVGHENALQRLDEQPPPPATSSRIYRLRAELPLRALAGDWKRYAEASAAARELARTACAPSLEWIADWGEAVHLASAGRSEEAVAKATAALAALDAYGERYRAARLLVDLLPALDAASATELAGPAALRLEEMGALASAAHARELA